MANFYHLSHTLYILRWSSHLFSGGKANVLPQIAGTLFPEWRKLTSHLQERLGKVQSCDYELLRSISLFTKVERNWARPINSICSISAPRLLSCVIQGVPGILWTDVGVFCFPSFCQMYRGNPILSRKQEKMNLPELTSN